MAKSQTRTVRSQLALARRAPSGLKLSAHTESPWPRMAVNSSPVATSQTLTVPAWLADARRVPSGLNATA